MSTDTLFGETFPDGQQAPADANPGSSEQEAMGASSLPPALSAEDTPVEAEAEQSGPVSCEFVCGRAGTGKSYWAKQQIAQDPEWGLLAATTGISAVNLDTTTINSALKYFDTASLQESYLQGQLGRALHDIGLQHRRLVIDEVSMMDARQLQLIYRGTEQANGYRDLADRPLGLVVVGDFAQLPPVKAQWAFRAPCWPEFAAHTTRLTHIWRQDQAEFLDALDAARRGDGPRAAAILSSVGIAWHSSLDTSFDGTTIIPKNDAVDRYNSVALDRLPGPVLHASSRRWGKPRGEWKNIPDRLQLKLGAYVMILSNDSAEWTYCNGDCGHVRGQDADGSFLIELVRNGAVVSIPPIIRSVATRERPPHVSPTVPLGEGYCPYVHRDGKRRFVLGQVEYCPLRVAYASTVHKSQGLSLDRCQIDFRQAFFGSPALLYVALSRCRTLGGLRLVGDRDRFIQRCKHDPAVGEWL